MGSDKLALPGTQVKMYSPFRSPYLSLDKSVLERFSAGKTGIRCILRRATPVNYKFDRNLVSCELKPELL
jgi:hypothetical protein